MIIPPYFFPPGIIGTLTGILTGEMEEVIVTATVTPITVMGTEIATESGDTSHVTMIDIVVGMMTVTTIAMDAVEEASMTTEIGA